MTTSSIAATAVVVGVDGSADSLRAVRWAAADAARRHRPLHLLHAHGWPEFAYPPVGLALPVVTQTDTPQTAARLLADAVTHARDAGGDLEISAGSTSRLCVPALLAASRQASLVVVGSRGLGGFAALLVGSTGVELAAHASCPVVIVRGADRSGGANAGRVVVGVDGSHDADLAVAVAFEQAAFRSAGLTAVNACQWQVAGQRDGVAAPIYGEQDALAGARRALAESMAGWQEKYPQVDVRLDVVVGRAGGVLAEASTGAELLVVGARGNGGFTGLLLGSVSQAAVHHANCPVIVARPGPGTHPRKEGSS
ncbi:universal stress protein [Dactylosporangium aurantiacum]|uniref:Universal stress protein n=1 Tax=Dactylosporangium aurantiacum TaxID=35754 RepID=A0A9Q9IRY1_9ACTN|nr:universal stress protein [Dactylosporangium aurantiacum]MDG6105931.1 universal stress protein [Dactylosporangium aurantiacum]UWZ57898.1 universal stress protein [Dactylosporangium aurantiacum]